MTPEQKQIAIAEFEGWTNCHESLESVYGFKTERVNVGVQMGLLTHQHLPPYLTSRDAICGAVARLDDGQKRAFANMLYDLITGAKPNPNGYHLNRIDTLAKDMVSFLLATPAQLSDALLLTLGYEL